MNIRVAIVEDNKLIREALQAIVGGTDGFLMVGAFANARQIEADVEFCKPDVILMDIEMPLISGIEATKSLKKKFPEVKVLIQTVFDDSEKIFKALCAGASGYILKSDNPAKQLDAIRDVYKGGAFMSSIIAQKVMDFFVHQNVILITPDQDEIKLSAREREILTLMMEGNDYRTIADKSFISYETVRTHIKHIYKKLHVACRAEAILKARQKGLI
ncbi:response regulator [Sphingobacterium sp. LRF_L2]|uniref:response regulator n=1 Tax=Sphingobacterium sp. LRF_L2 TaxID=3369421 RepID=UPI003F6176B5